MCRKTWAMTSLKKKELRIYRARNKTIKRETIGKRPSKSIYTLIFQSGLQSRASRSVTD
jgi:hypothetical protein